MKNEREKSSSTEGGTVVKLKYPVTFGERTITELTFRRLKARDMKDMPADGQKMSDIFKVLSRMCGEAQPVIEELDGEDLKEATKAMTSFLTLGQEIGENL